MTGKKTGINSDRKTNLKKPLNVVGDKTIKEKNNPLVKLSVNNNKKVEFNLEPTYLNEINEDNKNTISKLV